MRSCRIITLAFVVWVAGAPSRASANDQKQNGSLVSMAALGKSRMGMSISGGMAMLLPFYAVDIGYGVTSSVDLVARYETVVGVLHYPHVGVRWTPGSLGAWRVGLRFTLNYSFFGIKTDALNLTSTIFAAADVGVSRRITKRTELVMSIGSEVDLLVFDVIDDRTETKGRFHYDATNVRIGMHTLLAEDLHWYVRLRLFVPVETITFNAQSFYTIPYLEVGGTWSW